MPQKRKLVGTLLVTMAFIVALALDRPWPGIPGTNKAITTSVNGSGTPVPTPVLAEENVVQDTEQSRLQLKREKVLAEFGCPKMVWFCTSTWGTAKSFQSFNHLTIAALRSATVHAKGLLPVFVFYGDSVPVNNSEYDQIKFLVEDVMGGIIINMKLEEAYIWRFANISEPPWQNNPHLREIITGAASRLGSVLDFLRNVLPQKYPWFKEMWDNKELSHDKIIYSDSDVLFMPSFTQCQWPAPKFIGQGAQIIRDQGPINAGIVSFNPQTVTQAWTDEILKVGLKTNFDGVDQGVLLTYFQGYHREVRDQYPNRYNYKCHWGGEMKDAGMVHFWGAKPGPRQGLDCAPNPEACKPPLDKRFSDVLRPMWDAAKENDNHAFCNEMVREFYEYQKWPATEFPRLGLKVQDRFSLRVIYVMSIAESLVNLPEAIVALRSQQLNAPRMIPLVYYPADLPSAADVGRTLANHSGMQALCRQRMRTGRTRRRSLCGMNATQMVALMKRLVVKELEGSVVPVRRAETLAYRFTAASNRTIDPENLVVADHLTSTFSKYAAVQRRKDLSPKQTSAEKRGKNKKILQHQSRAESLADQKRLVFLATDVVFTEDFDESYLPNPIFMSLSERLSRRPAGAHLQPISPPGGVVFNIDNIAHMRHWDRALWAWAEDPTTERVLSSSEHEVFGDFFRTINEDVELIQPRFLSTTCKPGSKPEAKERFHANGKKDGNPIFSMIAHFGGAFGAVPKDSLTTAASQEGDRGTICGGAVSLWTRLLNNAATRQVPNVRKATTPVFDFFFPPETPAPKNTSDPVLAKEAV